MYLTQIYTYPIKSCGGLSHQAIELDERGPVGDRLWMVVDENGLFITQRELPPLAAVQPRFEGGALCLTAPGMSEMRLPLERERDIPRQVEVWNDVGKAWDEGDELAAWFSDYLKVEARLVRMADDFARRVNERYAPHPASVSFADAFPLLIAADESLAELNRRMTERGKPSLPMTRFRPNLVVSGGEAFAEDGWQTVQIGGVTIDLVKPCARCVTTTVDQVTGTIPDPGEPLATLNTFRRQENKVMFAQNAVHRGVGRLRLGDMIEVLQKA